MPQQPLSGDELAAAANSSVDNDEEKVEEAREVFPFSLDAIKDARIQDFRARPETDEEDDTTDVSPKGSSVVGSVNFLDVVPEPGLDEGDERYQMTGDDLEPETTAAAERDSTPAKA